jgi:hypothetical protein
MTYCSARTAASAAAIIGFALAGAGNWVPLTGCLYVGATFDHGAFDIASNRRGFGMVG